MSINGLNANPEVLELEEKVTEAMLRKDLSFLETVFSDNYVFLGSDGSTWGKKKALEDFRSRDLVLSRVQVSDRRILKLPVAWLRGIFVM